MKLAKERGLDIFTIFFPVYVNETNFNKVICIAKISKDKNDEIMLNLII